MGASYNSIEVRDFAFCQIMKKISLIVCVLWIVDANQLSGKIPSELGLLTQMMQLSLCECRCEQCSAVLWIDLLIHFLGLMMLGGNALAGVIPTELGLLTELTSIQLCK